jgi:thioredoxin-like negative regulator of GroEL
MLERFALTIFLGVLGGLIYFSVTRWLTRSRNSGIEGHTTGQPTILYFSSDDCSPCLTLQKPALKKLSDAYGGRLQIIEVDVVEKPDLASTWGVLSLPTTFIIDALGRARGVNMGVASTNRLKRQLLSIGETPLETEITKVDGQKRTKSEIAGGD